MTPDTCHQITLREHLEKRMTEMEERFHAELKARDIALNLAHDNSKQSAILWATALSVVVGIAMKLIK